jgi:hypothetical protein
MKIKIPLRPHLKNCAFLSVGAEAREFIREVFSMTETILKA